MYCEVFNASMLAKFRTMIDNIFGTMDKCRELEDKYVKLFPRRENNKAELKSVNTKNDRL